MKRPRPCRRKSGEYEVIYGMPKPSELKDFVNLKWFCGSFAGVDAYLDEGLYPSPEVMLSNSSGAYGVTIAEHLIMVTLMLLRHEVTYCADAAAQRWGEVLPMRSIIGSTITVLGTGGHRDGVCAPGQGHGSRVHSGRAADEKGRRPGV